MKECLDGTRENCLQDSSRPTVVDPVTKPKEIQWLEVKVLYEFRTWHIMFLAAATLLGVIVLLCCCFKFRIPRTKQEIEGDHIRRKILRKFRRRLKTIQNQELDDMDLKKALDKIREEFKSETESLAPSENEMSIETGSSSAIQGVHNPHPRPSRRHSSSTYRRASQIAIDISLEDLRAHSRGFGGRFRHALSRLFGRSKVAQTESNPISSLPVAIETRKTGPMISVGAKGKASNIKHPPPSKASAINLATGISLPSGSKVASETSTGVVLTSKNKKSPKEEKVKNLEIKKEEKKIKGKEEKKPEEKQGENIPVTVKIENEKSKSTKPKELKLTSSKKEKVKKDEKSEKEKVKKDEKSEKEKVKKDEKSDKEKVKKDEKSEKEKVKQDEKSQKEKVKQDEKSQKEKVKKDEKSQKEKVKKDEKFQKEKVEEKRKKEKEGKVKEKEKGKDEKAKATDNTLKKADEKDKQK